MAYSTDNAGANLPKEYGPWKCKREVAIDGPAFQVGADKQALEDVKANGFSITIFKMTFE